MSKQRNGGANSYPTVPIWIRRFITCEEELCLPCSQTAGKYYAEKNTKSKNRYHAHYG